MDYKFRSCGTHRPPSGNAALFFAFAPGLQACAMSAKLTRCGSQRVVSAELVVFLLAKLFESSPRAAAAVARSAMCWMLWVFADLGRIAFMDGLRLSDRMWLLERTGSVMPGGQCCSRPCSCEASFGHRQARRLFPERSSRALHSTIFGMRFSSIVTSRRHQSDFMAKVPA